MSKWSKIIFENRLFLIFLNNTRNQPIEPFLYANEKKKEFFTVPDCTEQNVCFWIASADGEVFGIKLFKETHLY